MKIYLSSLAGILRPLRSFLLRAVELGFNNVEILDEWGHKLNDKRRRELLELKRSYSLDYVVHAPYDGINISTPQRSLRRAALKLIEASMRNAQYLDARLIVLHSGFKSPLDFIKPKTTWNIFLDVLKEIDKLANDLDMYVGVENMPSGGSALIESCDQALMFIEEVHALERIGLTLDVGHSNTVGAYEARNYLLRAGDHLFHLHIHDNNGKKDEHLAVGSGTINWASIMPLIKRLKLLGGLSIEVMNFKDAKKSLDAVVRMTR